MGLLSSIFGSDDSSSTTSSTSTATNTAYETDRRAVASENAVSLTGDNNSIDRSNTTNFFDTSNRSSTSLTSFMDNSNRSTNFQDNSLKDSSTHFTDSSDRSVHNTVTDYGSVNSSLSLNGSMTSQAFGVAGSAIGGAIDVLKLQTVEGNKSVMAAFDMAKSSGANSMASSAAVLGFASDAIKQTNSAFAQAKDGGQSKMVMAAFGVIAAIGVAFALRN